MSSRPFAQAGPKHGKNRRRAGVPPRMLTKSTSPETLFPINFSTGTDWAEAEFGSIDLGDCSFQQAIVSTSAFSAVRTFATGALPTCRRFCLRLIRPGAGELRRERNQRPRMDAPQRVTQRENPQHFPRVSLRPGLGQAALFFAQNFRGARMAAFLHPATRSKEIDLAEKTRQNLQFAQDGQRDAG